MDVCIFACFVGIMSLPCYNLFLLFDVKFYPLLAYCICKRLVDIKGSYGVDFSSDLRGIASLRIAEVVSLAKADQRSVASDSI